MNEDARYEALLAYIRGEITEEELLEYYEEEGRNEHERTD